VKIYSWNVNGIRAVVRKGAFQEFMARHNPDILCLQETKAEQGQAEVDLADYEEYWNSSRTKKGYSGTAIFTKIKPLAVVNDIPKEIAEEHGLIADTYGHSNDEGRVIAAEFDDYYVVTAYTPNAKDDLTRIPLRQQWDAALTAYCSALQNGTYRIDHTPAEPKALQLDADSKFSSRNGPSRTEKYGEGSTTDETTDMHQKAQQVSSLATKVAEPMQSFGKPVIYCGDMNVAHTEDDLANPKPNIGKKGFTTEERTGLDNWLAAGFVDTFRLFTKGNGHYTWWSHFAKARERNVGWRIDYFLVSKLLESKVIKAEIHADQMGSDHCPVSIELAD
jgi:exodeoxyribonuclease-3